MAWAELARSERFRQRSDWTGATTHRFLDELANGDLDPNRFARYLVQDYAFVATLVDVLAYLVIKAPEQSSKRRYVEFLRSVLEGEDAYFRRSFVVMGVPEDVWRAPAMTGTTIAFRDCLLRAAALGDYAEGLAAFLAGEWVYLDWASRLAPNPPAFPPFREWITIHAEPDFQRFVHGLIAEFDQLALTPDADRRAEASFRQVVDLERAFWDMAYAAPPV